MAASSRFGALLRGAAGSPWVRSAAYLAAVAAVAALAAWSAPERAGAPTRAPATSQVSDPVLALAGSLAQASLPETETEGNAAGADSELLPRPPRATRIYGGALDPESELRVFTVQGEPVDALASYGRTLEASGFGRIFSSAREDENRRVFARRGVRAFVTASRGSSGTLLSIIELRGREAS